MEIEYHGDALLVREEILVNAPTPNSDNDRPVTELADLLGVSSHSAFAVWFRKHFGMSVLRRKHVSQGVENPRRLAIIKRRNFSLLRS
ncbi:hypothetical protein [Caballeronia novacaledonica]|uniref:HTH araC/xylS-type domain-containing protein n=1 Tax=Caballeronia novacaledonica TaxID=1544861 RepID=A0AA37IKN8_9BURK|nr:hypothetical protein [Caballeronia novacaledonica]GJH31009.1 hypothetical protein CBA19CS42_40855 [Caballeronia novacaledonica]